MRIRDLFSAVVVGVWLSLLAGCGGIDTSGSPSVKPGIVCSGDTYKSAGACMPLSACGPGQYVLQEATGTSDRICDMCPGETFSATANSPLCSPWATCQPGAYVASPPSATTDRLCSPCGAGTYTSGVNQSFCLSANDCPAGTLETVPGTPTTARACTPCSPGEYCAGGKTLAVPCESEQWDSDANPATQCVPKTACGPGTRVTRPGSATTNRLCAVCLGGTFSTTANATSCAPWRNCPAGTYVANMPTPSSNRWCVTCAANTFTTGENQSTCSAMDVCPAGTTETAPRTATTGPQCTPCSPGQYCAGGSIPPRPCGDQTWDHDGDPTTACLAWSVCQPGQQASSQGTPTTNRVCDPCPDGTFAETNNQSACQPWTTCPANTTFIGSPGTSSTNVACRPCRDNGCVAYCAPDGTCRECADHRDCAAGLSCVNGTCADLGCGGDDRYFLETFTSGPFAQFWTMSGECVRLIDAVTAAKADPFGDLGDAAGLSRLYRRSPILVLANRRRLDRRRRREPAPRAVARLEQKLPGDAFVLRQLASIPER